MQAIRRAIVEQHELDPYAIVLIRQTSLPITSSGKVQRNLCREQYLAGELKVVHSWTNPRPKSPQRQSRYRRADVQIHGEGVSWSTNGEPPLQVRRADGGHRSAPTRTHAASARGSYTAPDSVEVDRAAERIETWLLEWLVARLGLDAADVSRDRPFAEFGVDSLTAVELSQELEDEFKVPLPPIVAWNYPTPAALARYLAEQSLKPAKSAETASTNGIAAPQSAVAGSNTEQSGAGEDDVELAGLLADIENLSEDEVQRFWLKNKAAISYALKR